MFMESNVEGKLKKMWKLLRHSNMFVKKILRKQMKRVNEENNFPFAREKCQLI